MASIPPKDENVLIFRRQSEAKSSIHTKMASYEDRSEWLRLRFALWPNKTNHTHKKEINFMLCNPERFAAFLTVAEDNTSTGFIETAVHDIIAWGCDLKRMGYIQGCYVQYDMRGKGIGKKLMSKAQKWFYNRKVKEVYSDIDMTDLDSQKFYYQLGFTECERRLLYRKKFPM